MAGRNHQVQVKFSKEELERVKRKADEKGIPISTYLRFVALVSQIEVTG